MILVVDPGIRGCGVALFDPNTKTLFSCSYVKNPRTEGNDVTAVLAMANAVAERFSGGFLYRTAHVVIEWPRVYTASKSKGDNNDLPPLVGVGCAVAAIIATPSTSYFPHEWKGQITKEATLARVHSRLSAD